MVYWTVLMTITMIIMPIDEDDDNIFDNDAQMMLMPWMNMMRMMKQMTIQDKYYDVFYHDNDDDLW